jgi:serine/threonine protein kinase
MYVSPEVLHRQHNFKADVWSCGVIAFILLSGTIPFWDEDEEALFELIKKGEYDMTGRSWRRISKPAKDFVRLLLTYDKDQRPSA